VQLESRTTDFSRTDAKLAEGIFFFLKLLAISRAEFRFIDSPLHEYLQAATQMNHSKQTGR
jgi:hypothetical protein